ncbi:metalloprotease family protein [Natrinema caseinilyticum]|uniref:metalloprotease family protein n=1 Tax=Natrinema caseinilyticum TaxID=2961570 RepID=UPI0020C1BF8D|nr:metalloprotease family protein [Natrinema caseinilyticum]
MNADVLTSAAVAVIAVVGLAATIVGIASLLRFAIRLFSVPGVIVHEFAHKWACGLVGVTVLEVVYFRFGDPPGYVRHVQPDRYREAFVVSVAPFLVNTGSAFCLFLGLAALLETTGGIRSATNGQLAIAVVLCWFALSIGMYAFPSTGDANSLWNRSRTEWRRSPTVLLGVPVVVVIYVANLLSRLWADALYALGIGVAAFSVVGPTVI